MENTNLSFDLINTISQYEVHCFHQSFCEQLTILHLLCIC